MRDQRFTSTPAAMDDGGICIPNPEDRMRALVLLLLPVGCATAGTYRHTDHFDAWEVAQCTNQYTWQFLSQGEGEHAAYRMHRAISDCLNSRSYVGHEAAGKEYDARLQAGEIVCFGESGTCTVNIQTWVETGGANPEETRN
ncbi:MAG: hypothetical protein AAF517_12820 [Planctomycetota bacterium]